MCLIDNDGVVSRQEVVGLSFCQQNAVGHQLDIRVGRSVIVKTHFIANYCANFTV